MRPSLNLTVIGFEDTTHLITGTNGMGLEVAKMFAQEVRTSWSDAETRTSCPKPCLCYTP